MVVIDAFPGNNETSLAEFRINYLSPIVDFTFIVESDLSHSGTPKPLYFTNWLNENHELNKKIFLHKIDLSIFSNPMDRDVATREFLFELISKQYPCSNFILSDLDEIPSIEQLRLALNERKTFHFLSPTVYFHANWHLKDGHADWARGVIGHTSIHPGANGGRFEKFPVITSFPGIHFSWPIGLRESVMKKIESTAHTELAESGILDLQLINYAVTHGVDHLGRFKERGLGLFDVRSVDELSSIQFSLLRWNPYFFNFQLQNPFILKRILASMVCTGLWANPNFRSTLLAVARGERLKLLTKVKLTVFIFLQAFSGLTKIMREVVQIFLRRISKKAYCPKSN